MSVLIIEACPQFRGGSPKRQTPTIKEAKQLTSVTTGWGCTGCSVRSSANKQAFVKLPTSHSQIVEDIGHNILTSYLASCAVKIKFFDQTLWLPFFCCLFLCGYYSRVVFISLESPQTSTMAGW